MSKIKICSKALFILFVGAAFSITGCKIGSATTAPSYSCALTEGGFTSCTDLTGSAYSTATTAQTACNGVTSGGVTSTYQASACTTSGRVGSCVVFSGQSTEETIRYFTGYTVITSAAACSGLSGNFTPN